MSTTNYKLDDLYLKAISWFVSHKPFFRKWWVILFISANSLMIVYIIVSVFLFNAETRDLDQKLSRLAAGFISPAVREEMRPTSLETYDAKAVFTRVKNYDIVATIKNPNSQWAGKSIRYKYNLDGAETTEFTGFILPGETKNLVNLNIPYTGTIAPKVVKFELVAVEWEKVTDLGILSKARFTVEEKELSSGGITNENNISSTLTAKIRNESLYDFWQVEVPIVVKQGEDAVAVNFTTLRQFKSNEEREFSVSWFLRIPSSATVEITPTVNIIDNNNIMSL